MVYFLFFLIVKKSFFGCRQFHTVELLLQLEMKHRISYLPDSEKIQTIVLKESTIKKSK